MKLIMFLLIIYYGTTMLKNSFTVVSAKMHTLLRIKRFHVDPSTYANIFPMKSIINQYNYQQYISGYFKIINDMELHMFQMKIDRCDIEGVKCRYFNAFNFTQLNQFFHAKDQPWSDFTNAIHPTLQFPNPKKGWYVINNGTLNAEMIMFMVPQASQYYWKAVFKFLDKHQNIFGMTEMDFTIIQFIERHRSKSTS